MSADDSRSACSSTKPRGQRRWTWLGARAYSSAHARNKTITTSAERARRTHISFGLGLTARLQRRRVPACHALGGVSNGGGQIVAKKKNGGPSRGTFTPAQKAMRTPLRNKTAGARAARRFSPAPQVAMPRRIQPTAHVQKRDAAKVHSMIDIGERERVEACPARHQALLRSAKR